MMNILIAGDYCPFREKGSGYAYGEMPINCDFKEIISSSDYSIVNLECPVADDSCRKIEKIGPNLSCTPFYIKEIRQLGFKSVTMANNHVLDYGQKGVYLTRDTLKKNDLDYVGVGENLEDASTVLYKNIRGKRLAFINCCEREFSIATEKTVGAMPLDAVSLYYMIKEAKQNSDFVILIIHGGVEQYEHPTPRMVKTYRMFIDIGANVIINHHQHCYCGYEVYKNAPIFYGLGNFYFPGLGKAPDSWYVGYMVQLCIDDKNIDFKLLPYNQNKIRNSITSLNDKERKIFEENISSLNKTIADEEDLTKQYEYLLSHSSYNIISPFSNRYLQACVRRGYIPSFIPKSVMRNLYNKVTCVSHRERFVAYLEKILYETKA